MNGRNKDQRNNPLKAALGRETCHFGTGLERLDRQQANEHTCQSLRDRFHVGGLSRIAVTNASWRRI